MRDKLTGIYFSPIPRESNDEEIQSLTIDICRAMDCIATVEEERIPAELKKNILSFQRQVNIENLDKSKQFRLAQLLISIGYKKIINESYVEDLKATNIELTTTLDCANKRIEELEKEINKLKEFIIDMQKETLKGLSSYKCKKIKQKIQDFIESLLRTK